MSNRFRRSGDGTRLELLIAGVAEGAGLLSTS